VVTVKRGKGPPVTKAAAPLPPARHTISQGSVVRLKKQGRYMGVVSASPDGMALCAWFQRSSQTLAMDSFPVEALVVVPALLGDHRRYLQAFKAGATALALFREGTPRSEE
jgi:uncharacterized protein YodC (DUF2158 family)